MGSLEPKSWRARECPITADFRLLSWIKFPDLISRFRMSLRSELLAKIVAESTVLSPIAVSWRTARGAMFLILSLDSLILVKSSMVRFELLKWFELVSSSIIFVRLFLLFAGRTRMSS